MTAPKFTISILCCNRVELTQTCITSVLADHNCGSSFELIITDNGSTDGTAAYLKRLKANRVDEQITIITNPTNQGFIPPNNHALTLARGEFFVLLNNDMTVCEEWLERLAEPFVDPGVAVTGIKNTCTMISDKLLGCPGPKLEYIEGSCLMTPTWLARKHGLFPPYLKFIYWEDTAYSLRMRELGYRIEVVDLPINHRKRSQTITTVLKPAEIQAHLAHNTAAMKERWGFYFKRRTLERRLLVRRLGAHGDVLLATPALRALKDRYPQASIHVLTKCPGMLKGLDWLSVVTRPRNWYDEFLDLDLAYEKRPEVHTTQAFADVLGVMLPKQWKLHMQACPEDEMWAQRVAREAKVAVLHAGTSCWPGKNWPLERFVELVGWLRGRGYMVAQAGDDHSPELECDLPLAGKTTPQQLYALCKQASLFIGIDSMPQHVASAANCPSVVLYGPTNPRCLVKPTPRISVVQADRSKVPCVGEHGRRTKPVTQAPCEGECMKAISVEMVKAAVERVERMVAL